MFNFSVVSRWCVLGEVKRDDEAREGAQAPVPQPPRRRPCQ